MSQAASAEEPARSAETSETTQRVGLVHGGFEAAQSAWWRNLDVGARAAGAFQAQNVQFAGQLLDLNLQAARSFATPTGGDRAATAFEFGASALEICFGYLGRSAALAQRTVALPWTEPEVKP
jgi:hypothetical protein